MPYIGKEPVAGNFVLLDSITTSATATYALTKDSVAYSPESARNMLVSLNGVTQAPETAFTVSGSNITFSSALTSSDVIDYILVLGDVLSVGTPSDGTVGTSQMSYPLGNFSSTGIDDNADAVAITIDASENVGIGTTSPSFPLEVDGSTGDGVKIKAGNTSNDDSFLIANSSNTTMFLVDGGGNVGIGTASPLRSLQIGDNTSSEIISIQTGTTNNGSIYFGDNSATSAEYAGVLRYNHNDDSMQLWTTSTERMRVDSSGNLLVGKSSTSTTTAGGEINADGTLVGVRDGGGPLLLNRLSSDGTLASFRKGGTIMGSIDSYSGAVLGMNLRVSTNKSGFRGAASSIIPWYEGADRDNELDIGNASVRWDDVYATNGTIQTSDANEKQDIETLSEAETRVAVAAKGLLRKFRWKSAVEEKGDDARIHFGIIAQDLKAAFEAEGLNAGRYAMFIHSTWTDEETGEERSRMGVRYSELLAFIIAAI
jgi:hypothetical protein